MIGGTLVADREQGRGLIVCFLPHEISGDACGSLWVDDAGGLRDDGAPTAALVGITEAAVGLEGGAQGRQGCTDLDRPHRHNRSADAAESWSCADLSGN